MSPIVGVMSPDIAPKTVDYCKEKRKKKNKNKRKRISNKAIAKRRERDYFASTVHAQETKALVAGHAEGHVLHGHLDSSLGRWVSCVSINVVLFFISHLSSSLLLLLSSLLSPPFSLLLSFKILLAKAHYSYSVRAGVWVVGQSRALSRHVEVLIRCPNVPAKKRG